MLPSSLYEDFLTAMRERIATMYLPEGVELDDEDFTEWMVKFPDWNVSHVKGLLDEDAEAWEWDEQDIEDICGALKYDNDLLSLFFTPVSLEVIQHTIQEHAQERNSECSECKEYGDQMAEQKDLFSAYEVLIGYLNHVYVVGDDDDYDEDDDELVMIRQFLPEFMRLPKSRQYRVLAYLHEQSEEWDEQHDDDEEEISYSPLAQLVDLRLSLPATLRKLVDQAVSTEEGCGQLSAKVHAQDLATRIEEYCETLLNRGVDPELFPLQVEQRGDEAWIVLDPAYVRSWRALIQADESGK